MFVIVSHAAGSGFMRAKGFCCWPGLLGSCVPLVLHAHHVFFMRAKGFRVHAPSTQKKKEVEQRAGETSCAGEVTGVIVDKIFQTTKSTEMDIEVCH